MLVTSFSSVVYLLLFSSWYITLNYTMEFEISEDMLLFYAIASYIGLEGTIILFI